jgi:hypothetical protein
MPLSIEGLSAWNGLLGIRPVSRTDRRNDGAIGSVNRDLYTRLRILKDGGVFAFVQSPAAVDHQQKADRRWYIGFHNFSLQACTIAATIMRL